MPNTLCKTKPSTHYFKPTLLAITIAAATSLSPAYAQQPNSSSVGEQVSWLINLPAAPLADSLNALARQTGLTLSAAPTLLQNISAPALAGNYQVQQALELLLANSALQAVKLQDGSYVIKKSTDEKIVGTLALTTITSGKSFGDAPAEEGGFKAEYQATATKMAMPLKETPQAISVVTNDSITARQVDDLYSALELTAGVAGSYFAAPGPFSGSAPNGGSNTFSVRGQRLDGQNDIRSDGFAVSDETNYDAAILERVELIKGPSGLYGQGSLGGFINMVRKKPQAEFSSSVSVQAGSYDTYRGDVDITGALTEDEMLKGRLIAVYSDEGSFIEGVETKRYTIAPSIEGQIGENTRALLQLLYQNEDFIPTVGLPLQLKGDKYVAYDLERSFYYGDPNRQETSTIESFNANLQIDHQVNDNWLASVFLQSDIVKRKDINNSYGYGYGDNHYFYASKKDINVDNWAGELRVDGQFSLFGAEHQLVVGIEVNERKKKEIGGYAYLAVVSTTALYNDGFYNDFDYLTKEDIPISSGDDYSSKSTAVYMQAVFNVTPSTKLLVGTRYDKVKQERVDLLSDNAKFQDEKDAWTTRIGVIHEFTDNISAYSTYAQSFTPVEDEASNLTILAPETGEGYEVGLKTEWFESRLGLNLAIYRQELDNQAIDDPDDKKYSISGGLQRTDGIELELNSSPINGLTLSAAISFLDSEYIDELDPNFGKSAWGAMDSQFSLYTGYEIQSGVLKGLNAAVTYIKTGDTATSTWTDVQYHVEGYDRTDLNFTYRAITNWDLSLQIRNLFDATYIEKVRGGGWYNYYGAPRTALFKATYHFD